MDCPKPSLFELFWSTFCIGAVTFGGGYAMIPVLEQTFVSKKGWLSEEEMMDLLAIAEMTPGPIAINASTYVGTKMAGLPGAVSATLGMVMPSFLIIALISGFYLEFKSNPTVAARQTGRSACWPLPPSAFSACRPSWSSLPQAFAAMSCIAKRRVEPCCF